MYTLFMSLNVKVIFCIVHEPQNNPPPPENYEQLHVIMNRKTACEYEQNKVSSRGLHCPALGAIATRSMWSLNNKFRLTYGYFETLLKTINSVHLLLTLMVCNPTHQMASKSMCKRLGDYTSILLAHTQRASSQIIIM